MATKKLNTQTSEMTSRIFGNFDKNIGRIEEEFPSAYITYKIRTTTAILLLSKEKSPELPLRTRPCRILKR